MPFGLGTSKSIRNEFQTMWGFSNVHICNAYNFHFPGIIQHFPIALKDV